MIDKNGIEVDRDIHDILSHTDRDMWNTTAYILSSSISQAYYYSKRLQGHKTWALLNRIDNLHGVSNGIIYLCGEYYKHNDYYNILEYAVAKGFSIRGISDEGVFDYGGYYPWR